MHSVAQAVERLDALAATEPVAVLAHAFADAGHELALVGGPVRDAFLGRPVTDLDFTTDATPDETLRIVEPIASATWDVGRQFGTIAARIRGEQVEITTYRSDVYDGETRKPEVAFGDTIEDDLLRRDFTVNAMALRLPQRELVDVHGGVEDLLAERLHTPQTAEVSFRDDPLRMMRAARFTAQLGFTVSDEVRQAMTDLADSIEIVSAERVRDELVKLLDTADPVPGIRLLVDTGLAERFLPELPAMRLEIDEHHHHKDVYEHSLTVLTQAIGYEAERHAGEAPDTVLRLAALLHDIGKPATRKLEPGGAVSFHHHDLVGSKLVKKRLRALRFDNDTIAAVARLVELHLRFFGYTEGAWTDSAVRRYVRDAGPLLERLHELTRSDVTTRNRRKADRLGFAYDDLEQRIAALAEQEELDSIRPDLTGDDIMRILDIRPGRAVGEAYRYLLELRMDEGPLGADEAEARLRAWWADRDATA
ncbi:CCA tRNA nucleotidyltransferase [Curtobacterium sp. C1]|uniref:CCA tRNA nucleotidyltransferase n=1 Tax=Curtobacterium TaxID=2034 RepID=UPI000735E341|nr:MULTISPECIES: CCA tRNA nucleotidyltransferase [Curtobacterium]KTR23195.1 RNA nucleotidyltransferase [Curtobacterium citreum]MCS5486191.1 CCA tRNA nucleotidyltransferase [Curtobacterium flaccumfaciens pv. basellae]UFU14104.1 CCA tRNA nucleotidyltransferase [Curtobacterium sp. C1]WIJ45365.1 CCA tRNA nucleotidyltransferase [Curtobacterium citreum]